MKYRNNRISGQPESSFKPEPPGPESRDREPKPRREPHKPTKSFAEAIELPAEDQPEWTIPPAARKVIPSELVKVVVLKDGKTGDYENDTRVRIAASQALVAMNRQNQTSAKKRETDGSGPGSSPEQIRAQLVALAERLRLGKLATAAGPEETETCPRTT